MSVLLKTLYKNNENFMHLLGIYKIELKRHNQDRITQNYRKITQQ